jgi:hypothetical protein
LSCDHNSEADRRRNQITKWGSREVSNWGFRTSRTKWGSREVSNWEWFKLALFSTAVSVALTVLWLGIFLALEHRGHQYLLADAVLWLGIFLASR